MAEKAPPSEPREFAAVLLELGKGATHALLSKGLREVVAAVKETGNKGSVVPTLEVTADDDGDTVTVTDKVVAKIPQHDRKASRFYVTDDGDPVRDIPNDADFLRNQLSGRVASTRTWRISGNWRSTRRFVRARSR